MISVVIPAFNEEKNIARCLASIAQQNTNEEVEVIVVDNGSTDRTKEIVEALTSTLNLRLLHEPQKGRGAARRTGFAAARGSIIFSTDADTIVPPHWVDSFLQVLHKKEGVVAATSFPRIEDCSAFQNALLNFFIPHFLRLNIVWVRTPGLSGYSFAIKREAYEAVGGFNPESDAYEDVELAKRITKHRIGKIKRVPKAPVVMSGRRFQKSLIKGCTEYVTTFTRKFVKGQERVILEVVEEEKTAQ